MKKLALLLGLFSLVVLWENASATCEGSSLSCGSFNTSYCPTQDGCSVVNVSAGCSGSGDCMDFSGQQTFCEAFGTCSWNVPFPSMCSGSYDCSSFDQSTCEGFGGWGCTWTSESSYCGGTHTACSSYNDSYCSSQVACFPSSEASTCSSCNDCSAKLHAGHNVTLANDISGYNSYYGYYSWAMCIYMDNSSTVLDCNGHWILGDNYSSDVAGILLYGESGAGNVKVSNCHVTGYSIALLARGFDHAYTVEDSTFCEPHADKVCSGYKRPIFAQRWQYNTAPIIYDNVTVYGAFGIELQANITVKNSRLISVPPYTDAVGFMVGNNEHYWFYNNIFNVTGAYASANNQGTYYPEFSNNYYLNYNGTGYSDICNDTNDDGICDNPYTVSIWNSWTGSYQNYTDSQPLLYSYAPEQPLQVLTGMALTLSDAGTGLGSFLDAITNPVTQFIMALGFVGGIMMIVWGFVRALSFAGQLMG